MNPRIVYEGRWQVEASDPVAVGQVVHLDAGFRSVLFEKGHGKRCTCDAAHPTIDQGLTCMHSRLLADYWRASKS